MPPLPGSINTPSVCSQASLGAAKMSLQIGATYTITSKATSTVADYSQRDFKVLLDCVLCSCPLRTTTSILLAVRPGHVHPLLS